MKNRINIILIILLLLLSNLISEAQWFTQQSGTTAALYDIELINRNTGWCCGDGGYIIKTTNGGTNWIRQTAGVPGEPLFGIHPVDSNIVYAVGFFRTFIKTTNGGSSWFSLDSGMQGDGTYQSVFFLNPTTGWAGFGDGTFFGVTKTTDGGNTFAYFPSGVFKDIYFKDSLNGIGVNASPFIFRSSNGGINWLFQQLASSGNCYRVSFINENTGYTASTRAVYKTTNFGLIWDSIGRVTSLDIDVTSIEFSNENIGWAGTNSPVYKTTNGGGDWFLQILTGVVYNICSINDSLVWTCGNGGRIWHTTTGGISFIYNITNEIPLSFELKQNYPNPFNSTTTISYNINKDGDYKLEIYNVSGQLIKRAFEQKINKGAYKIIFDATELNSGVYFYKLSSEKLSQTKKFLLIK